MTDPLFHSLKQADIQWREDGLPFAPAFDDLYFSRQSGINETNHVFINQNQLSERWSASNADFTIGETGFGTGLNFLVAADHWLRTTTNRKLHFISVEKFPVRRDDLAKAYTHWPQFSALTEEFLLQLPPPITGVHRLSLAKGRISLTLLLGDADKQFSALKGSDHPYFQRCGNPIVDAWFLDGFAPSKNPAMWTEELFQTIADLSAPGTTFATFTAAGLVRRGLQKVGFDVHKAAGFGNKREMLAGVLQTPTCLEPSPEQCQPTRFNSAHQPPWYLANKNQDKPATAIVIGGGIAGCSTARALAERNIKVMLIERRPQLAGEGSGNLQGIIYPKLSTKKSPLARFSLAALLNAGRFYQPFWSNAETSFGKRSGVIVLSETEQEQQTFNQLAKQFPAELVQLLRGNALSDMAGVPLDKPLGLFFSNAGWISPSKICQALSQHDNINLLQGEVDNIQYNEYWQVFDKANRCLADAEAVVIACGASANQFSSTAHLPLKAIRGQISHLPVTALSEKLKTVICGEGYLAPAIEGTHTLGATYNLNELSQQLSTADHQKNLKQLVQTDKLLGSLFNNIKAKGLPGRAAFRCTTPDYLPIAGPVPKLDDFLEDYALLGNNARAHIPVSGSYWPNLYINCGHGSRGMSYAPLCAEMIASDITGQMPPLELDLRQAIHPGRFIIRNLKRGKL